MFGPGVDEAIKAHAIAKYPEECCGFVIDGAFVPVENVFVPTEAEGKGDAFRMPDDAWPIDGRVVQAVVHSHCAPKYDILPSASDIERQIATAVPWGIVLVNPDHCTAPLWFGDQNLDLPLVGRKFVHGVTDCYDLIRAYYWQQRGVKLMQMPRDNEWWRKGQDLYAKGFGPAGFKSIELAAARPGDVILMKIRSDVTNHAGILLPGELMLHHLQGRLSASVPLDGAWRRFISHWLRYEA